MAQWLGQYSGNTHLSKVRDLESQLRHAIDVYRQSQAHDVGASKVRRLANDLHKARIRVTKARIAALDPRMIEDRDQADRKLKVEVEGGMQSILDEFDANDIHVNG